MKGNNVAKEIINYAKREGITKIILGKPRREGAFAGGIYKDLILQTEGIDVYLIAPRGKKDLLPKEENQNFWNRLLKKLKGH